MRHSTCNRAPHPTVIVTGASSGVGLYATQALVRRGWHVIGACRDLPRAERAAAALTLASAQFNGMQIDLESQGSVRNFVASFKASGLPLDGLICNAGVYLPRVKDAQRSRTGYEISDATNHPGHYLLCRLLLNDLQRSRRPSSRLITLGTVTNSSAEFGGKVPIPAPADLGDLQGLKAGFKAPIAMIDDKPFKPGKACKNSKPCNMMMSVEFHNRFHDHSGVVFNTLYLGCVADTALFRGTPPLFRTIYPWFQKHVTKDYVSQKLAGKRVAQLLDDPGFARSGLHWSWGNRQRTGREPFARRLSGKATNTEKSRTLLDLSEKLVGLI